MLRKIRKESPPANDNSVALVSAPAEKKRIFKRPVRVKEKREREALTWARALTSRFLRIITKTLRDPLDDQLARAHFKHLFFFSFPPLTYSCFSSTLTRFDYRFIPFRLCRYQPPRSTRFRHNNIKKKKKASSSSFSLPPPLSL